MGLIFTINLGKSLINYQIDDLIGVDVQMLLNSEILVHISGS